MSDNKSKFIAGLGAGGATVAATLYIFLGGHEGEVLKTYKDPIGIITSCRGHTGPELKLGQTFTIDQCEEQTYGDLLKHLDDIDCIQTPLGPNQKVAFLSFGYNVGKDKLCSSTLARKANAGDMRGACDELLRWTQAGGRTLPGLVKRRKDERDLCISDL